MPFQIWFSRGITKSGPVIYIKKKLNQVPCPFSRSTINTHIVPFKNSYELGGRQDGAELPGAVVRAHIGANDDAHACALSNHLRRIILTI